MSGVGSGVVVMSGAGVGVGRVGVAVVVDVGETVGEVATGDAAGVALATVAAGNADGAAAALVGPPALSLAGDAQPTPASAIHTSSTHPKNARERRGTD